MCVLYAVSVLSLLSVAAAIPVPCDDVTKSLDSMDFQDKIMGKWIVIAATANDIHSQNPLKDFDSFWLKFSQLSQNDSFLYTFAMKLKGDCIYFSYNATLENSTITLHNSFNTTGVFLPASDGYLALSIKNNIGYHIFYLLGKEAKLSDSEQDMFEKQEECLCLKTPVFMDLKKELCPEKETTPRF
ncbi:hypothetical protein AGOR_G00192930 [Albula goreensis]|uniref:Lipocalin/cytosolic fatty-acid binding domain-containing protein n=1 Tax=Albula goreensis TaxID=1534307 RepID=A0A8T3CVP5_9TELE|nr:hypothetical protein AGOR_G00192930 [Albula goreensis]